MQRSWLQKAVCRKGTQKDKCVLELCTCYLTAKGILKKTLSERKAGDYSTSSEGHTVFKPEPFSIPVCFCFSLSVLFSSLFLFCASPNLVLQTESRAEAKQTFPYTDNLEQMWKTWGKYGSYFQGVLSSFKDSLNTFFNIMIKIQHAAHTWLTACPS